MLKEHTKPLFPSGFGQEGDIRVEVYIIASRQLHIVRQLPPFLKCPLDVQRWESSLTPTTHLTQGWPEPHAVWAESPQALCSS